MALTDVTHTNRTYLNKGFTIDLHSFNSSNPSLFGNTAPLRIGNILVSLTDRSDRSEEVLAAAHCLR